MMMHLCSEVLNKLEGKTLVTAESCTGGGIGAALTAISGSSRVYKGGIICYTDEIKITQLSVAQQIIDRFGAVSAEVAEAMASGARKKLSADVAVSVTGLAGPGGDAFGNPIGTVYIGYSDEKKFFSKHFLFTGDREAVRNKTIEAALKLVLSEAK